jgi:hemolysin III
MKPRLRGVLHQYAFPVSLVTGTILVLAAPSARATFAAVVYGLSVSALFAASALWHRGTWSAAMGRRIQRLDHAMIFLLIAGTYTPFGLLALSGTLAVVVLAVVWSGALLGMVLSLFGADAPRWLRPVVCVALGWVAVAALPQMVSHLGWTAPLLLLLGGALYSAGALVYGLRWPDPAPAVFGYHEIFHALVVAAALVHYGVVAVFVLPRA